VSVSDVPNTNALAAFLGGPGEHGVSGKLTIRCVVIGPDSRYHIRVRLRTLTVAGVAGILGLLAALLALGNSSVPVAGVVACPVLLVSYPVFDHFPDLSDAWLWVATCVANALTYAALAWGVAVYLLRSRQRSSNKS